MSIWLLIGCALAGWTVVSVAFAFWLARYLSALNRRGGYVEITPNVQERIRPYTDPRDKSAA